MPCMPSTTGGSLPLRQPLAVGSAWKVQEGEGGKVWAKAHFSLQWLDQPLLCDSPLTLRAAESEGTRWARGPSQPYLDEGEDEAHDEVGEPVDRARHDEGRRPLGLLEELAGQDKGDAACRESRGAELVTPRRRPCCQPPSHVAGQVAGEPSACVSSGLRVGCSPELRKA